MVSTETRENVLDVVAILDQFERDHEYIDLHRDEWLKEYPEEWVIVYGEELVAHAGSLDEALKLAGGVGQCENAAIELITNSPCLWLL